MSLRTLLSLSFITILLQTPAQELTQNIRGQIIDRSSQSPLPFATVIIVGSDPLIGVTTNIDGFFVFENVPLGRYDLQASFIGYEPVMITEVLVTAAKEVSLKMKLRENTTTLDAIVVKARVQKESSLNEMATVSARMLSVEEANRYAGGFDDPARLASSFAGVASNVGNNAIIIRGNAPKFLQWKMEGIEIPNPNHFADLGAFGGGGLTAISSNLLANSDFFTGAFPAEYNNALSGVFDIQMRSGNNSKFEHSFEVGFIGIDFASEGPLSKKSNASYLVNYRYSTLGLIAPLLPEDAQGTNYQDLAFKLKFPTKKAGAFSFWGIGLIDNSGTTAETDAELRNYYQDTENAKATQYMSASGINHMFLVNNSSYLNSTLAVTLNGLDLETDRLDNSLAVKPQNVIKNKYYSIIFKSFFNKKFSSKHTNRTGVGIVEMNYDLLLKEANADKNLATLVSEKGSSALVSAFSNSTFSFKNVTLNIGLNGQVFTLNQNHTIEPRIGLAYQLNANNKLTFGYGLHSRIERLNTYFTKTDNPINPLENKALDFSKAHHLVVGYDRNIGKNTHLKIETYFQYLFDIPTIADSTFSLINSQNDWFINAAFVNKGKGRNYGIDFTLEQYIHNGFYYLVSASIFDSKYKTDTDIWYNTRFNRGFLINALAGKEYQVGKNKQNLFSVNFRISLQGGDRYSLVDPIASKLEQDVVYNEVIPFSEQSKNSLVSHLTVNYKWNKKKTHALSLKIINVNGYKEFLGHRYNIKTQKVEEFREALLIPNLSYKVSF